MKQNFLSQDNLRRLLSLLIAIIIWMWVSNIKNPVVDLEYTNIIAEISSQNTMRDQYGLVITENEFPKVSVTLTGERELVTRVATQNIVITADVSHITEPGTYELPYTIKLPFESVQVKKSNPSKITITVDKFSNKELPLSIEVSGTPKKDYYIPEITAKETVHISAPLNILSEIEYASVNVDISDRKTDINDYYIVKYYGKDGNIISNSNILAEYDSVLVTGEIFKTTEIELSVGFENEHIKENISKVSISPSKVEISGKPEIIDALDTLEIGIITEFDYNDGVTSIDFTYPEIENIEFLTEESITATITYNKYISKYINALDYIVPSDVDTLIDVLDEEVSVEIFGETSDFNYLATSDIKISFDITKEEIEKLEKGTLLDITLIIDVSNEFEVKGTYKVSVQVK